MSFRHISTLILTPLFLIPAVASAQALDGGIGNTDPFTVSVSPDYPTPGGQAAISFLSSTIDLNNAILTVLIGGKQLYKGSVQPIAIPLGGAGSVTSVTVKMTSAGASYSQSLTIQPEDVSIIAEPLSSAPPLYLGKPLVPLSGNTRVVAVANFKDASGKKLDPSSLSYAWTVDDTRIDNMSGIGKESIVVASPRSYRERTVSVSVRSQTGDLVGGATLTLNPSDPSVRIYKNDPLLGILFDHALAGTYAMAGNESSFYAAPFSLSTLSGAPVLRWFVQGSMAQTGNLITLRSAGAGKGTASISLTATSADSSAEATANLSLTFGNTTNTFFGL